MNDETNSIEFFPVRLFVSLRHYAICTRLNCAAKIRHNLISPFGNTVLNKMPNKSIPGKMNKNHFKRNSRMERVHLIEKQIFIFHLQGSRRDKRAMENKNDLIEILVDSATSWMPFLVLSIPIHFRLFIRENKYRGSGGETPVWRSRKKKQFSCLGPRQHNSRMACRCIAMA